MSDPSDTVRPRAVLAVVELPDSSPAETQSSLAELGRLVHTLGFDVIAEVTQKRRSLAAAAIFGKGKLRELARYTGGSGIVPAGAERRQGKKTIHPWEETDNEEDEDEALLLDLGADPETDPDGDGDDGEEPPLDPEDRATIVVVDHELTPSQLRSLQGATSAEVLDRSAVILNIFQRHARTREAKLQVEIAQLIYLAPRMRLAGRSDRQRGGIGGKGAGESSAELDRRRVRDRIAELRRELEVVQRESDTRRSRRVEQRMVAIVGYTNAGKSSLMRRLTESEVLVQDKLFATLDTTVRSLWPETRPRILVSDTVGFIKKLPHDLVASFRSTLEEARDAGLLMHVVDASDPSFRSQLEVTHTVLGEVGANDRPTLLVLNKIDQVDEETRAALAIEFKDAIQMSALDPTDVAALHEHIVAFFEKDMIEDELFVSYGAAKMIHTIYESCRVLEETHEESGTRVRVRAPKDVLDRLAEEILTST